VRAGARGERLTGKVPHVHWKTATFVAGLRSTTLTAPGVIDGSMISSAFMRSKVLAPSLASGYLVVMDNLAAHKVPGGREAIGHASHGLDRLAPLPSRFS